MGHPVRINGADVAAALAARSREPFAQELARMLEAAPSPTALRRFANRSPDRWAQAAATLARLAGYTERTESLNFNLYADIMKMSDAELYGHLAAVQRQLSTGLEHGNVGEKPPP